MIPRPNGGSMAVRCVMLACVLCGCKRTPGAGQQHSDSPREALLAMLTAMKDADAGKLLAVTQANDEQKQVIEAGADCTRAMTMFRDAFLKAYGREAWESFQDPARRPGDHDAFFALIGEAELLRAQSMNINAGSNDANCTMPIGSARVRMLRTDKGWLIDGRTFVPEGQSPGEVESDVRAFTGVVRRYQPAIGQPGITPGDIDAELGRAMREILGGAPIDGPRRFDVSKFATSSPGG